MARFSTEHIEKLDLILCPIEAARYARCTSARARSSRNTGMITEMIWSAPR